MNEAGGKYEPGPGRPVVFGEVLFDDFEAGPKVIGGAAFNLAWNLESFGLAPLFISRIGSDSLGEQVLEIMRSYGMDTSGVQVDGERRTVIIEHPSGHLDITLRLDPNGEAPDNIIAAGVIRTARPIMDGVVYV